MIVTGTLGTTPLEGGCVYLLTADGARYEVIWPAGWHVDRTALSVIGPDGSRAASAGDTVTVRGEPAPDIVSARQLGPVLRATEVVSIR